MEKVPKTTLRHVFPFNLPDADADHPFSALLTFLLIKAGILVQQNRGIVFFVIAIVSIIVGTIIPIMPEGIPSRRLLP